ncbi:MAG: 4-hydroxybenzoate octaprenyltransferase [Candidatus Latescibacteria bacterium]|nr:4-hydroxybenzoate octaprenyltransferase [Candidatus Latescibacterota bacterium]
MKILSRVLTYGRMIKFSHSVFALPFALTGALLASLRTSITGPHLFWIVVAMVGARSAAMGFNRLVDHRIDTANPRTRTRELPAGVISVPAVAAFIVLSSAVLVFAAYRLNPLCLVLSPVALLIIFFYSFTKRFTWASHAFLGLSLSVAPIGAWIAVRGTLDPIVLLLGAAVLAWVAGFDIIYACQDYEFDLRSGLRSIPQRLGLRRALIVARLLHVVAFGLLLALKFVFGLNGLYLAGVLLVGVILIYEHRLVRHDDLSRLNAAFFTMNGILSVTYFVFTLGDVMILKG